MYIVKYIKPKLLIISCVVIAMGVVLCGCCGSEQMQLQDKPAETTDEAIDQSEAEDGAVQEEETAAEPVKVVEPVKVEEDADFGNLKLSEILTKIRKLQARQDDDYGFLPSDIFEYVTLGPGHTERALYYDLADLNEDGYRELVIGGDFEADMIYPLGVYMYIPDKDELYSPTISYLIEIHSDGTIQSYQGNSIHGDDSGFFFRIDPYADGGIKEVSASEAGKWEFNWKRF